MHFTWVFPKRIAALVKLTLKSSRHSNGTVFTQLSLPNKVVFLITGTWTVGVSHAVKVGHFDLPVCIILKHVYISMCPGPQCRRAGGVKAGSRGRAVPRDRPRSARPSLPGQPTRPAPQVPFSGARHQPFTLPGGKVFSKNNFIDPLMTVIHVICYS